MKHFDHKISMLCGSFCRIKVAYNFQISPTAISFILFSVLHCYRKVQATECSVHCNQEKKLFLFLQMKGNLQTVVSDCFFLIPQNSFSIQVMAFKSF